MKLLTLPKKVRDIVGETFGRLTVRKFSHISEAKGRNAVWICECDCGETTFVKSSHLRTGATQSCGCLARELSAKRIKAIHNTGEHLYFIRCDNFFKIGRASNVNQRLSQLQAANPFKLELMHVLENQGHREKEFHEKFKNDHWSGEWFVLNGCEVVDIT